LKVSFLYIYTLMKFDNLDYINICLIQLKYNGVQSIITNGPIKYKEKLIITNGPIIYKEKSKPTTKSIKAKKFKGSKWKYSTKPKEFSEFDDEDIIITNRILFIYFTFISFCIFIKKYSIKCFTFTCMIVFVVYTLPLIYLFLIECAFRISAWHNSNPSFYNNYTDLIIFIY